LRCGALLLRCYVVVDGCCVGLSVGRDLWDVKSVLCGYMCFWPSDFPPGDNDCLSLFCRCAVIDNYLLTDVCFLSSFFFSRSTLPPAANHHRHLFLRFPFFSLFCLFFPILSTSPRTSFRQCTLPSAPLIVIVS